ncbi:MAG: hypothetical protein ACJAVE_001310 [Polaribacter sp.]|jgi:hypothetical protein|tara:strand:+ start:3211 stop:3549 length:339 start_codon:yes stop_codon:yes gene_type:complete
MRNIFLLLISTAITSLGIARLESVENSSSKIIGNLTKVVWIDAQETKGNLLLENSLVAGFEFSDYENENPSKEVTISKNTLDFYTFDGCQNQITFYDFYYKINKIVYTKGVV